MTNKNTLYSKKVIEIADFMFKHPDKKMSDVLSHFVVNCRKNRRTIERYVKQAKQYNKTRLNKQEQAKEKVLVEEAKESIKRAILTRYESLETLSTIAKGTARKIGEDVIIPSDGDRIRAIQQLAKMEGWEAPIKTDNTVTFADPFAQMRKNHGIDTEAKTSV
ncbi:MAG: hypothetical protein LBC84_09200 [Prevotellaceae bacterium]|jgi:hypothetical protein|nr:hypothetical protein [Prevotellaceae bacterium]